MMETQHLVPQVYFDKSRDFQLLSHVYDIVFNYLKTNVDLIYNIPFNRNSDKELINHLCYTLGFKVKHKYNTDQLIYVCGAFMDIMQNKGNIQSIKDTLSVLFKAENIKLSENTTIDDYVSEYVDVVTGIKYIYLYTLTLQNTSLLEDILDYILPVGVLYRIIDSTNFNVKKGDDDYYMPSKIAIYGRNDNTSLYKDETPILSKQIGSLGTVTVPRLDSSFAMGVSDSTIYTGEEQ